MGNNLLVLPSKHSQTPTIQYIGRKGVISVTRIPMKQAIADITANKCQQNSEKIYIITNND